MEIKSWVGVFIHKPYQGGFLPLKTNAGRLFSGTIIPTWYYQYVYTLLLQNLQLVSAAKAQQSADN